MTNPDNNYKHTDLTEKIIGCAYQVYNALGAGFIEKIYENALMIELKNAALTAQQQYPVKVYYQGILIGDYVADIIVEDKVIVELKAVSQLTKAHEVQLVNYLKATKLEVGLLINFGDQISIKRKVLSIR
ncbi:MAG: GxxExxY protein [Syntrophomonadaceae bacterium]|jgi:GxxExxY protein|nr:GxxExxY protein [Syntrophomonadaceae bacterium]